VIDSGLVAAVAVVVAVVASAVCVGVVRGRRTGPAGAAFDRWPAETDDQPYGTDDGAGDGATIARTTAGSSPTTGTSAGSLADVRDPAARIPILNVERLRAWLADGAGSEGRVAVVSVALDNLTAVAEQHGERSARHLLEAIAYRLRTVTRPRDVVAHVDRERFVLVCRDVPDRAGAEVVSERIAMAVAHPSVVLDGMAEVTASIGVAMSIEPGEEPEAVLRRSIAACRVARERGGGQIEISMTPSPLPSSIEAELQHAFARDEFLLHYLPMVSLDTGRLAGFETLLRWQHPDAGLLLPADFLADAERTGVIVPLGLWVLEHACEQLARWHATGAELTLSVNLSPRQFAEPTLAPQVKRIVADAGLRPGSVWLELTEDTLLAGGEATARTLRHLDEVGVRIVIDDFGSGRSSLVSLKQYPLHGIKVDRAFVVDVGRDRDSDAICSALVDLARSLGLRAIAEGIETPEQHTALRAIGCEFGQGHLFGRARPAAEYGDTPPPFLGSLHGFEA
jgi:diguanylate cyclase (GGDEF)-like protein